MQEFNVWESRNYREGVNNEAVVNGVVTELEQRHKDYFGVDLHSVTPAQAALLDPRIHCVLYVLSADFQQVKEINPNTRRSSYAKDIDALFLTQVSPLAPIVPITLQSESAWLLDVAKEDYYHITTQKIGSISVQLNLLCIHAFQSNESAKGYSTKGLSGKPHTARTSMSAYEDDEETKALRANMFTVLCDDSADGGHCDSTIVSSCEDFVRLRDLLLSSGTHAFPIVVGYKL